MRSGVNQSRVGQTPETAYWHRVERHTLRDQSRHHQIRSVMENRSVVVQVTVNAIDCSSMLKMTSEVGNGSRSSHVVGVLILALCRALSFDAFAAMLE